MSVTRNERVVNVCPEISILPVQHMRIGGGYLGLEPYGQISTPEFATTGKHECDGELQPAAYAQE
jgi:hypothetical protein